MKYPTMKFSTIPVFPQIITSLIKYLLKKEISHENPYYEKNILLNYSFTKLELP